ncbi:MAG: 1-acyl-sn-glycerol-3-phosphate acyltransferase [Muribaculaceae bacterium]|nr:1-acyl-sn-glycerol-3-phosphate acyltransferase [Muribaculaceae bacterium]
MNIDDFKDIAPIEDSEFKARMAELVDEPAFENAVKFVMPDVDYQAFAQQLRLIESKDELQKKVMLPFLELLEKKTSSGMTFSGAENYKADGSYTVITNHRDIVLDASFLNLNLLHHNLPTTQVAIGDNLLIYEWINTLVRLNKSFIVRRNLKIKEALDAARHLSAYIHYCISTKKESIWIAQREGRAKDSSDLTQESLIKMLGLSGPSESLCENVEAVNLLPTSISYEYDPNDYLKVKEYILKQRDPEFKKSQHDDLLSMETGILSFKGHIHFHISPCISDELRTLPAELSKQEFLRATCDLIDRRIHAGYEIYPINYVAYDKINGCHRFDNHYTNQQEEEVVNYIGKQLARVDIPDLTAEEKELMLNRMYSMYANPLINKLKAKE